MPSTVASLDYALKERYSGQRVETTTLRDNVALDMATKDEGFSGDVMPLPIIYGAPQGISASFASAQANQTNVKGKKWNIEVGESYAILRLGDKAIKAARDNMGAFLKHQATETDELLNNFGNHLSVQYWGNGGAPFGQRASASTNVITLVNRYDAQNFEPGMTVVASAGDGSSASDALRVGSTTVASVDYEAGTVTLTSAAGITSFANSDYLFPGGSFAGDVSQTILWKGIQAWIPASAPTSTAFFGMDRSTSTRLSGYRLPTALASGTIEERLRRTAIEANTLYGATPRKGFLHPRQWEKLSIQLDAKGVRPIEVKNNTGTYGYEGLVMRSNYGKIEICSDRHCPTTQGWLKDPKHIKIMSMTKMVHAMNGDGMQMLRVGDDAAYEMRWASYAQVAVDKPSAHARCTLPAVT